MEPYKYLDFGADRPQDAVEDVHTCADFLLKLKIYAMDQPDWDLYCSDSSFRSSLLEDLPDSKLRKQKYNPRKREKLGNKVLEEWFKNPDFTVEKLLTKTENLKLDTRFPGAVLRGELINTHLSVDCYSLNWEDIITILKQRHKESLKFFKSNPDNILQSTTVFRSPDNFPYEKGIGDLDTKMGIEESISDRYPLLDRPSKVIHKMCTQGTHSTLRKYLISKTGGYVTPYHVDSHEEAHFSMYSQVEGKAVVHLLPSLFALYLNYLIESNEMNRVTQTLVYLQENHIGTSCTVNKGDVLLLNPCGGHAVFVPEDCKVSVAVAVEIPIKTLRTMNSGYNNPSGIVLTPCQLPENIKNSCWLDSAELAAMFYCNKFGIIPVGALKELLVYRFQPDINSYKLKKKRNELLGHVINTPEMKSYESGKQFYAILTMKLLLQDEKFVKVSAKYEEIEIYCKKTQQTCSIYYEEEEVGGKGVTLPGVLPESVFKTVNDILSLRGNKPAAFISFNHAGERFNLADLMSQKNLDVVFAILFQSENHFVIYHDHRIYDNLRTQDGVVDLRDNRQPGRKKFYKLVLHIVCVTVPTKAPAVKIEIKPETKLKNRSRRLKPGYFLRNSNQRNFSPGDEWTCSADACINAWNEALNSHMKHVKIIDRNELIPQDGGWNFHQLCRKWKMWGMVVTPLNVTPTPFALMRLNPNIYLVCVDVILGECSTVHMLVFNATNLRFIDNRKKKPILELEQKDIQTPLDCQEMLEEACGGVLPGHRVRLKDVYVVRLRSSLGYCISLISRFLPEINRTPCHEGDDVASFIRKLDKCIMVKDCSIDFQAFLNNEVGIYLICCNLGIYFTYVLRQVYPYVGKLSCLHGCECYSVVLHERLIEIIEGTKVFCSKFKFDHDSVFVEKVFKFSSTRNRKRKRKKKRE